MRAGQDQGVGATRGASDGFSTIEVENQSVRRKAEREGEQKKKIGEKELLQRKASGRLQMQRRLQVRRTFV